MSPREPLTMLARALPVVVTALLATATVQHAVEASETAPHEAVRLLDVTTLAEPGPYQVLVREVMVPRPDGAVPFGSRLYIPGTGAQAATSEERAPVVAFGHGYLAPVELYEQTLEHLASWGLVAIAPRSGGELFPDHADFATDLATAARWVAEEAATDPDWPGLPVDPQALGLSGHSMGGGAAVLAAADDPGITTVATLAAANTRPSAIAAATELGVPTLYVAASDDRITPVERHQRPMFDATPAPAQLRIIEGGSHCGFLDSVPLEGIVCDVADIGGATQAALSRGLLTAWLRTQLAGDPATAAVALEGAPDDGTSIEWTRP